LAATKSYSPPRLSVCRWVNCEVPKSNSTREPDDTSGLARSTRCELSVACSALLMSPTCTHPDMIFSRPVLAAKSTCPSTRSEAGAPSEPTT
jgi:hypothetical protein